MSVSASRERTDALLAELREGGWRPAAWGRFLGRGAFWSTQAALTRPYAAVQVTALHAAIAAGARGRHRSRIAISWGLSISHLGLLGPHRQLGWPNALTLIRANLPALGDSPLLGVVALATDMADGRLARRRAEVTAFGSWADALADAAFWTTFAYRTERSRIVRTAAVGAWAVPVAVITAASIGRGRMVDPPRPRLLRPAAALQVVLAVRALRSTFQPASRHDARRATTRRIGTGTSIPHRADHRR